MNLRANVHYLFDFIDRILWIGVGCCGLVGTGVAVSIFEMTPSGRIAPIRKAVANEYAADACQIGDTGIRNYVRWYKIEVLPVQRKCADILSSNS